MTHKDYEPLARGLLKSLGERHLALVLKGKDLNVQFNEEAVVFLALELLDVYKQGLVDGRIE